MDAQSTDRNAHHAAHFGEYAALPLALGHVVELGCGPYTQVQTILNRPGSSATTLTLVDPLAAHYARHVKGCTYSDNRLYGRPVRVVSAAAEVRVPSRAATRRARRVHGPLDAGCGEKRGHVRARWCARTVRMVGLRGRGGHARDGVGAAVGPRRCQDAAGTVARLWPPDLLPCPPPDHPPSSAPTPRQAAYNALKPGGWLVFSDRVFDGRWDAYLAADAADAFWDVGHPCSVKQVVLDHFLSAFEEVRTSRRRAQCSKSEPTD
jgi:hypothetical protein